MHIHILGICGTFMGSLALLAKEMGLTVSGADQNVYPPMSTQLEERGIDLIQGYDPEVLDQLCPDLIVIGNAMTRGNPVVEYVLDKGIPYTSGPQFFAEQVLRDKWVMAVAGTHGKTTTSSMLAWVLEYAGMSPGFLIGGVPENFGISARTGDTPFFVVEADEYDTAFFDKRSKFVHYHPRTLIMNNLEYDHADIFPDLSSIQKQFHHLVRTVPASGRIIMPGGDTALEDVISMGCWSEMEKISLSDNSCEWSANILQEDGSHFEVLRNGLIVGQVCWEHQGRHNVSNALTTIAAARHVGVLPARCCEALSLFCGVKRRMELVGEVDGVRIYDDFAHHPTAIASTLEGLRAKVGSQTIRAIIELRSNTMKMGHHKDVLAQSTAAASEVLWFAPEGVDWLEDTIRQSSPVSARVMNSTSDIIDYLVASAQPDEHWVIMSNGGFEKIHTRLLEALKNRG